MSVKISNEFLEVAISETGAELQSIKTVKDSKNTEYLWQGDPAFWKRRAPILFPIVGCIKDGQYSYDGRAYPLPQHGFARDLEFSVLLEAGGAKDKVTFRLKSDEKTRGIYPFDFALTVGYALTDGCLTATHKVENTGAKTMYFSIGEHPGFNLTLGGNDKISDYFLEFEQRETLSARYLINNYMDGVKPCFENENIFPLDENVFIDDAYAFEGLKSKFVTLKSRKHDKGVRVGFDGYPYLGIWAPVGAPFVCIEPWFGIASSATESGDITQKEGIIALAAGKTFECCYTVEIF